MTDTKVEQVLNTVDMQINMGPQHPATHGVFRMVLTVDGERIRDVEPYIGYLHRGAEKLMENESYLAAICHMDRTDYVANFNAELPFVMAVDKLLGVEVPRRAEYVRVLMCELNRIVSHLMFYGAFGTDAGAMTPFLYAFRERERLQALFESVSGARMMHNFFRPGGVRADLPADFARRTLEVLKEVERGLDEMDDLLTGNEVFLARTKGVGIISAQEAIDFGVSGPTLRASGVAEDLRRAEPYSVYPELAFEVPVGVNGDCFDRYWVRVQEIRQSASIVRQAIDGLPEGPIMGEMPRFIRPKQNEVYVRTESARGDLGVYLIASGKDEAYRAKVRSPCFCNLSALRLFMRNAYVADAVVILGSLDIVLGEVDR